MLAISAFFRNSNYAEAGLWLVIALGLAVFGSRSRIAPRNRWILVVTLVAFGGSDVVEAHTGAWWDPWWLLVWKGVCVAILLAAVVQLVRARRDFSRRRTQINADEMRLATNDTNRKRIGTCN